MDAYLQGTIIEMESATDGLTDTELNSLRLAPGKWTAAQTLEHLILAFTRTTRHIRNRAREKPAMPSATLKQRIGAFVVVRLGHTPTGSSAPEFTRPAETPTAGVCDRFRQAVREMDAAIMREQEVRSNQKIAVHAVLGPLTAREWRRLHLVHTRHHMDQIRAMRRAKTRAGASAA